MENFLYVLKNVCSVKITLKLIEGVYPMFRDRGIVKWGSSFILPEHNDYLRQLQEDLNKDVRPLPDEQRLADIAIVLRDAINRQQLICFTFYENGRIESIHGFLAPVRPMERELVIKTLDGRLKTISFDDLSDAQLSEGEVYLD